MARVASMDIAKGIAIACVVVGHSGGLGVPAGLVSAIFTFHMPLFFILSGYFTRPDVRLDAPYVEKCARSLLAPYAWTCLAVLTLWAARLAVADPSQLAPELGRWAVAALYGAGAEAGLPAGVRAIGAVWFLLALFWGKLLLAAANRAPYTPWVVLGLFVLGYASAEQPWLPWLPFSVQAGLCATLFMYVGQRLRAADAFAPGRLHPLLWAAAAGAWAVCMAADASGGQLLAMVRNYYPNGPVVDVLGGVCGTMCVVKLSQQLERWAPSASRWLARLGAATLPVFCAHLIELDAFPWHMAMGALAGLPAPVLLTGLALRCSLVAALAAVLYLLPRPVSGAFYASRRLPKGAAR